MSQVESAKVRPTVGSKLSSTVVLFAVPMFLLAIIGMLGGGFDIGLPEISIVWAIVLVGLIRIWRPRR